MTYGSYVRKTAAARNSRLILAAILCFTLALLFPHLSAFADDVDATAQVGNSLPVANSVTINNSASTIHLTENTTTEVTVTATVTDDNGCEDIGTVQVVFFRTDVTATAPDDDNNHYTVTASEDSNSCKGGGSDLASTYTATIDVNYYADPTDSGSIYASSDWTAEVTPSDAVGEGTAASDTIEMSTLTALNTSASVAYGEVALGSNTGTTDQTVVVTNTGNEGIDVDLDGYGSADDDGLAMTCTVGSIPVGNERYSNTANTDYTAKTPLTDSATTLDLDVPQRTGGVSTANVYWGLGMPAQGVNGNCSGTIVFTANSDPNLD